MKYERIYLEMLMSINNKVGREFTQQALAKVCDLSISTVNYALKPLEKMGAIRKNPKSFTVIQPKKLLVYWSCMHKVPVAYKAYSPKRTSVIESEMPEGLFTCYSGARLYHDIDAADYSEVHIYADPKMVEERFPFNKKEKRFNIFCLQHDPYLSKYKQTPLPLIYVDLWNMDTWYANEFLKQVEVRLNAVLE